MPRKLPLPKGNEKIWYDLLPSEAEREHGRHLYMFRNIQTNQVVYTLFPKIHQRTLRQLPFIGKHSQPPRIRPDVWAAHCRVGPFPTAEQGLNAMRKLRELRRLHETRWDVTQPEIKSMPKKKKIKAIMNQRANSTADIAKVLTIQGELGGKMVQEAKKRKEDQEQWLAKRWTELDAQARAVENGKVKELEQKINDCKAELGNKKDQEAEVKRLNERMVKLRREIREHLFAQRITQKRDEAQEKLEADLQRQTERTNKRAAALRAKGREREANALPIPTIGANEVRESLLPAALKSLPQPYTVEGVECHWADLYDAEFAGEQWPTETIHDTLAATEQKRVQVYTEEEYEAKIADERAALKAETERIVDDMRFKRSGGVTGSSTGDVVSQESLRNTAPQKDEQTGIWKYMPARVTDMLKKPRA